MLNYGVWSRRQYQKFDPTSQEAMSLIPASRFHGLFHLQQVTLLQDVQLETMSDSLHRSISKLAEIFVVSNVCWKFETRLKSAKKTDRYSGGEVVRL